MSIESGNVSFCTPAECHVNRTAMRTTFALPREIKRENNDQGLLSPSYPVSLSIEILPTIENASGTTGCAGEIPVDRKVQNR